MFLFGNLNIAVEWAKIALKQRKFSTDVGFFTLPYFLSNGVSKIHDDHGLLNIQSNCFQSNLESADAAQGFKKHEDSQVKLLKQLLLHLS